MYLPNAIIAGAPKCGTTSLASFLATSDEVCLTNPKETLYWWRNHHRRPYNFLSKHYKHMTGHERIFLEASAYTASIPYAIKRVPKDADVIYCVREPMSRAYSEWLMRSRVMVGHCLPTFNREMLANIDTYSIHNCQCEIDLQPYLDPNGGILKRIIVEQGAYGTHLSRMIKHFKTSPLVVDVDGLNESLFSVCDFLGIDVPKTAMPFENVSNHSMTREQLQSLDCFELLDEIYRPEVHMLSDITGIDFVGDWGYR